MPEILDAPAPGADLSLPEPTPQPAAPPDWASVESHPDFQALPESKKLQVANVYADTVRDHALSLPGADPNQVNASVEEWRKQQTAAIAPPAAQAPEGSPEYQVRMRAALGQNQPELRPVTTVGDAYKEGGVMGVLAENVPLVSPALVRHSALLNPMVAPFVLGAEAIPGTVGKAIKGANEGAAELVSGLTTPANVALLGTGFLGKTAQRLISAGFSADMLSHVPEQIKSVADAPDAQEAAKRTVGLIGNLVFGVAAGAHALGKGPAPLSQEQLDAVGKAPDQAVQIVAGDKAFAEQHPEQHDAAVREAKARGLEPITDPQHVVAAQDASDSTLEQAVASPEVAGHPSVLAAATAELEHRAGERVKSASDQTLQIAAADTDWSKTAPVQHGAVVDELQRRGLQPVAAEDFAAAKEKVLDVERQAQAAKDAGLDATAAELLKQRDAAVEELKSKVPLKESVSPDNEQKIAQSPESISEGASALPAEGKDGGIPNSAPEQQTPKEVTENGRSQERQGSNLPEADAEGQKGQVLSEQAVGSTPPPASVDWRTAEQRTPEHDAVANKDFKKAAKQIEKAQTEQAKIKPNAKGYSDSEKQEYAKQQAIIDAARATKTQAEAYAKLPEPISPVRESPDSNSVTTETKPAPLSSNEFSFNAPEQDKTKWLQSHGIYHFEDLPPEVQAKVVREFDPHNEISEPHRTNELKNDYSFSKSGGEAPGTVRRQGDRLIFTPPREAEPDLASKAATHFDRLTAIARARNAPDAEVAASDAIQSVVGSAPKIENDEHLGALLSRSLAQQVAEQHTRENRLKRGGDVGKVSLQEPVGEGQGSVADTVGDSYKDTTQYKTAVDAVLSATEDAITKFAEGDATKAEAASLVLKEQGFVGSEGGRPSNAAKTLAADPAFKASVQKGVLARIAADIKSRFDESVLDSTRLTNNDDAVNQAISNVTNLFQPGKLDRLGKVARGWFGAIAGRTLPRFTVADRDVGEKGARYISSKIAAEPLAGVYASKVLEGLPVDAKKLGAALTEDNLRSVREQNLAKADEATKAGDDKQAAEYKDRADNTASMIGKGKPFKDEAEYQAYLADPSTQTAIARHKELWEQQIDPMYKKAQGIDPDEELPPRGLQTGARINLFALQDGDKGVARVSGSPSGGLTNTFKRKSPFATEAKGTASNYETAYGEIIKNTFGRQLDIANYNDFVGGMVDKGLAQIGKPGQHVEIDGENTVAFPLQRRVVISDGKSFSVSENVYIKSSLAPEFRSAVNVDPGGTSAIAKYVFRPINNAALYGLTDATVHVSNLATALFTRPAVAGGTLADTMLSAFGRADVPVTLTKAIIKGFQDNKEQLAELASIGAARAEAKSTTPLLGWSSKMIHVADKVTRLVLDDAYQSMVKAGLVEDTETNRREFVNQVGQYNRRAVTGLSKALKDAGISPFVTAGTTFNRLGLRMVGLQAGVEHTSALSHAITMTNVAMKWVGAAALIGAANYALTHDKGGGVLGRPGVPIGNIDTGQTDENDDKPLSIPAADLIGMGRGLRATGVRGYLQAKRNGLTEGDARDSALRDVVNTAVSPFAGPGVRLGSAILFNRSPGIGTPPINHIVPPTGDETQKSQIAHNILKGLGDVNPGVAGYLDRQENPSLPTSDVVKRQLPRFTLRPSNSIDMMENYPSIVHKAQVNSFIEDTVYTARRLKPADRADYVQRQVEQLPAGDQKHLRDQLKRRRVNY